VTEHREDRRRELNDDRDRAEQSEPQNQREADADLPAAVALMLGQLVGDDGNEDEIVDPEHDFHRDQGQECHPGHRIGGERDEIIGGEIQGQTSASKPPRLQSDIAIDDRQRGPDPGAVT
jgi:hypothetical protein